MSSDRAVEVVSNEKPVFGPDEAKRDAEISVELLNDPKHERKHFRVPLDAKLLEVLDEGAKKLGVKLLPNPETPLDPLRGVEEKHNAGESL